MRGTTWTKEEDGRLLAAIEQHLTWPEIAALFAATRTRGSIDGRAKVMGLTLTPEGFKRSKWMGHVTRAKSDNKSSVRNRTHIRGQSVARVVVESEAQAAARKLQNVAEVYPMRIKNPKWDDWFVWGQRMSAEAMIEKAAKHERRMG